MRARYQQRCVKCRKNMVMMYSAKQFPICAECQLKEINQPISNKTMTRFFNIPHDLYEKSQFLRSVKSQYLRFGSLSPAQKDTFKKVVKELKEGKKAESTMSKGRKAKDDTYLREKLVKALDHLIIKDTKAKRRDFLVLLEDMQAQPITHEHLQRALDKLTTKVRGRPKILLMKTSELKRVMDDLAGAP